jgi:hypothetical protein
MASPPVFTVGQTLTSAAMNQVGLWRVASTNFTASPGVEIQNCFTSDFRNYKVFINVFGNNSHNLQMQFMTGTNTKDNAATYDRWGFFWNAGINNFNLTNDTQQFVVNYFSAAANYSTVDMTIFQPNVANVNTITNMHSWSGDSGLATWIDHSKRSNSAFTGFYIFPGSLGSQTITGNVTVYGMRNS